MVETVNNSIPEAPTLEQKIMTSGVVDKVLTYWGKASGTLLEDKKTRETIHSALDNTQLLTALLGPKIAGMADGFKIFLGTDTEVLRKEGLKGEVGTKLLNDGITSATRQLGFYAARKYLGLNDPQAAATVGGFIGTLIGDQASKVAFKKLGIPHVPTAEAPTQTAQEIANEAVEKYKAQEAAKEAPAPSQTKEQIIAEHEAAIAQAAQKAELEELRAKFTAMQQGETPTPTTARPAETKVTVENNEPDLAAELIGTDVTLAQNATAPESAEVQKNNTTTQVRFNDAMEAARRAGLTVVKQEHESKCGDPMMMAAALAIKNQKISVNFGKGEHVTSAKLPGSDKSQVEKLAMQKTRVQSVEANPKSFSLS